MTNFLITVAFIFAGNYINIYVFAKESYEVKKSSFWRLQSAGILHHLAGNIVPYSPQWHAITSHKNLNLQKCHCINIKSQYLTSPYRPGTIKKIRTDRKCGWLNSTQYGVKCVLAWQTAGLKMCVENVKVCVENQINLCSNKPMSSYMLHTVTCTPNHRYLK